MSLKSREYSLKRLYGIGIKEYNSILAKQDYKCAICKRPHTYFKTNLCVDHEHSPEGPIRGLLCSFCNRRVIGRHRNSTLFYNAAVYLEGPFTGYFVPKKVKKKKRNKR